MSERPLRIVVSGCSGRMGSLILSEALQHPDQFEPTGALEHAGHPSIGQPVSGKPGLRVSDNLPELLKKADLLIEFTTPAASLSHAECAAAAKVPVVIGTTGFTEEQFKKLKGLSRTVAIFWSPNMSIGIVIVRRAIAAISELLFGFGLGNETKVAISETHHTQKKDRPSGTAKALAQELLQVTGWLVRDEEIEAKREGETIGIHSVTFHCPSEKITLTHEATDRQVFAQGALLVAHNFHKLGSKPNWYGMDDFVKFIQKSRPR